MFLPSTPFFFHLPPPTSTNYIVSRVILLYSFLFPATGFARPSYFVSNCYLSCAPPLFHLLLLLLSFFLPSVYHTYFPPSLLLHFFLLLFPFSFNTPYEPPFFHVEIMQRRRRWLSPRITLCLIFLLDSFLFFFFLFLSFFLSLRPLPLCLWYCLCTFGLEVGRFLRMQLAPGKSEFPVVRVACDWEKTPCGLSGARIWLPLFFSWPGKFYFFPFCCIPCALSMMHFVPWRCEFQEILLSLCFKGWIFSWILLSSLSLFFSLVRIERNGWTCNVNT